MNTDELIEQLHKTNATERQKERVKHIRFQPWWLAVPAAAALILMILLPTHSLAEQKPTTGLHVYCNNNCQKEDALSIIQQNINEIKSSTIKAEL